MKKLVAMGLAATMVLGLTACSGGSKTAATTAAPAATEKAAEAAKTEETKAAVESKELKVSHVFA